MSSAWAATVAGAFTSLLSGALYINYLRWRRIAGQIGRLRLSSRDGLDVYAYCQWLAAGPCMLSVALVLPAFSVAPFGAAPLPLKVTACCVTLGATVMVNSGHIDWFWILPRISGVVRPGPCESGSRREEWTYLTEIWLSHRFLAEALVSASILAIPGYLALELKGNGQLLSTLLFGLAGGVIGYREKALVPAALSAADPAARVGEIVRIHYEEDERDKWSWAYVVDVSVQGAKVIILDDSARYTGPPFQRQRDYVLVATQTLRDAPRNQSVGALCGPHTGCGKAPNGCTGVNWYCHCNPRAHTHSLPRVSIEADPTQTPTGARTSTDP